MAFCMVTNPSNTIHSNPFLRTITIDIGDPVTYKTWNEKITPAERKFDILTNSTVYKKTADRKY